MRRLISCAALLALASPLRAGEAAWRSSADFRQVIRLPADWTAAAAAVPGLTSKGMPHAFSLAPRSRAFVLDIAAENALDLKAVPAEDRFARALKLAGAAPALREELPDKSLFEYFKSPAGRAGCRVQGVLYKYIQRYYLTFSSAKGCPGGKDWKEAMQVLATLEFDEPAAAGWEGDFLKRLSADGLGQSPAAAAVSLRDTAVVRADGTDVGFDDIEIFGCKNFAGNLYLFNTDQTAHCWIATLADYTAFLDKLSEASWKDSPPVFQACPLNMKQERACVLENLRHF